MKDVIKQHEWDLAINHRKALEREDYETCALIKSEINRRINNGTIDHSLMDGFKYYDHKLKKFIGEAKFEPYNGLFDNYKFK